MKELKTLEQGGYYQRFKEFVSMKRISRTTRISIASAILMTCVMIPALEAVPNPPRVMEWLDRGLVALEIDKGVFLSWRVLGSDDEKVGFDLYRNGTKITSQPITSSSNYVDNEGSVNDRYSVQMLSGSGATMDRSREVEVWARKETTRADLAGKNLPPLAYKEIPLDPPDSEGMSGDASNEGGSDEEESEGGDEPAASKYTPGDMSVGDLDGDGQYELVFEWEGVPNYLEAITLDGKRLWRISGGPNVDRQKLAFMVYDLDGDGKAEVVCKTGPGTKDGTGRYLHLGPAATDDDEAVLERKSGRLVEDPSYITVFNGETGAEMATALYWPQIGPRKNMEKTWGDNYGHRSASIKAAVLGQKGDLPLVVFARGIYSRIAMGAYRWDGRTFGQVWTFDTEDRQYRDYEGQGNHSLAVGDVDGDGSDELMYGACAIDHNGRGLYTTGRGHGDSHALGDLMPDHPGLEFFQGHENSTYGVSMRDAATGEILWEILSKADVGRAWAADVNAQIRGAECASSATPNLDCNGNELKTKYSAYNYPIYFDGDVERELRNRTVIENGPNGRILEAWHYRAANIHSSKRDANLVADILGDWREEIIFRRNDNRALLLFTTWLPTERKNYTLMHDPLYRMNIVVQGIGYNQVANVGYYFPDGAPRANITYPKVVLDRLRSAKP